MREHDIMNKLDALFTMRNAITPNDMNILTPIFAKVFQE